MPGGRNGPADAYRHCVGSGELTRTTSRATAWAAGHAWELKTGGPIIVRDEWKMDIHNNMVGRQVGVSADTFEDVEQGCTDALNSGDLKVLDTW